MNGNGKEYAMALFSLALENGTPDEVFNDLSMVRDLMEQNPEYPEFIINPAIPKSERIKSIKTVFEGRVCDDVFSFLNVICGHGDMHKLNSVISEYTLLYEDYKKFAEAVVTSAVPLTDEQKGRLVRKLSEVTGKRIVARYIVDEKIIGGISVIVDGKFFDGSIRRNLNNIKEVIA